MAVSEYIMLSLFIVIGLFSLISAVCNFDWFFHSKRATTFVQWFGRQGARLFYGLLGLALIGCGVSGFLFD